MLPENLVPARFHISAVENRPGEEGKEPNLAQGKTTLSEHANNILANASRTGQSRNMLLEERDRHIKERLFRVVKIEAFARLLNDLQAEGEIDAQALSKIISDKTQQINEAGNEIWLNLITRETDAPMFYKLGDE
ncbi:hypothetical protein AAEY27_03705 [Kosakonia sp. BYX6]|uniref:Cytoplasmic protein n=1 Tax=Kosakonia calanthes TaxID=3139408 RepID=A0ABZ3B8L6_9ENTR